MADLQVKSGNICNITSGTGLYANAGGSGTYIADNSISVHMTNHRASGIYVNSLPEQGVKGDKYTISFVPVCATNNVMYVVLYGTTTQISFTSGNRYALTITATAADGLMAFYGADSVEKTILIKDIQIEKGETATVYRPYSATGWVHSLRKLATATDTFTTLPADIYADGNNATVGLKGNMEQNGTPTPDNPIMPQGTGDRTANLFDKDSNTINNNGQIRPGVDVPAGIYSISNGTPNWVYYRVGVQGTTRQISAGSNAENINASDTLYVWRDANIRQDGVMFNTGSTALPYEPYGYKIPISSASTTTPVYLGEIESTRRIKKLVLTGNETWTKFVVTGRISFYTNVPDGTGKTGLSSHFRYGATASFPDLASFAYNGDSNKNMIFRMSDDTSITEVANFKAWLAAQYAAGTPVTVWYVLATPETGIVNEPIRKIGNYADTLSGITIPTIAGANTLSVDTTVQPSEVSVNYKGWHNTEVKEWDGSQWN